MEDGQNDYSPCFLPIVDAIREALYQTLSNIVEHRRLTVWVRGYLFEHVLDRVDEPFAEAGAAVLVPVDRLVKLALSLLAEDNRQLHDPNCSSARDLT